MQPPTTAIRRLAGTLSALVILAPAPCAWSETAVSLSDRIVIDGAASEYLPDETMFQTSPSGRKEESFVDSKWGVFDDLNQIRITWDARFLYVAVEGFVAGLGNPGNNMMLFFDSVPVGAQGSPGLEGLTNLTSWSRNLVFDGAFRPDLFLATWDGNTTPQVWTAAGSNQVTQTNSVSLKIAGSSDPAGATVATLSGQQAGRAMEAAIPWDTVFLGQGRREFRSGYDDTVYVMPEAVRELRVAAWITTAGDGFGGPDTAPDNLSGHQVDAGIQVVMDNYMIIPLDRMDVLRQPEPDFIPDFGVQVRQPTVPGMSEGEYEAIRGEFFFIPPPIRGQAVEICNLRTEPRLIAPELNEEARFRFTVCPPIEDEGLRALRTFPFTAELYDLGGQLVRVIYREQEFTSAQLEAEIPPPQNVIDGRDAAGSLLEGGTYVLVVVYEPLQSQARTTVTVVR